MNSAHSARVPASVMSPRHQDTIQGSQRVYRGEFAQRVTNASVASRATRTGLHATAVALADEVQVRQMRHAGDRRSASAKGLAPSRGPGH